MNIASWLTQFIIVAPTSDLCNIWVTGIYRLLVNTTEVHKNPDPVTLEQDTSLLLRKLFREMDTNGDEKLDLNEVMQLFKKLNLNLSKSGVKSTFKVGFIIFTFGAPRLNGSIN